MKPGDLHTIQDFVHYIRFYAGQKETLGSEKAAASIVGLSVNDHFDNWYKADADMARIVDNASALEWSNSVDIPADWQEIEACLIRLEKRYNV
jgi:hypothetical protein